MPATSTYLSRIPRLLFAAGAINHQISSTVKSAIGLGFRGIDADTNDFDTTQQTGDRIHTAAILSDALTALLAISGMHSKVLTARDKIAAPSSTSQRESVYLSRDNFWLQATVNVNRRLSQYDASTQPPRQHQIRDVTRALQLKDVSPRSKYLDALVMSSPCDTRQQTAAAWQELSTYVPNNIGILGIKDVTMAQLDELYQDVDVKPTIVQNAFTPETGYDQQLRAYCKEKGIVYQGYDVLKDNDHLLESQAVKKLSAGAAISREQALQALVALALNVRVLVDNTKPEGVTLSTLSKVQTWRVEHKNEWMSMVSAFKGSLSRGRIL